MPRWAAASSGPGRAVGLLPTMRKELKPVREVGDGPRYIGSSTASSHWDPKPTVPGASWMPLVSPLSCFCLQAEVSAQLCWMKSPPRTKSRRCLGRKRSNRPFCPSESSWEEMTSPEAWLDGREGQHFELPETLLLQQKE